MNTSSPYSVPLNDVLTDAYLELESIEMHELARAILVAQTTLAEQAVALNRPPVRVACDDPDEDAHLILVEQP